MAKRGKSPGQSVVSLRVCEMIRSMAVAAGHQRGWQTRAARVLGVNAVLVSGAVTGNRSVMPGPATALRACVALGIKPEVFLSEKPFPAHLVANWEQATKTKREVSLEAEVARLRAEIAELLKGQSLPMAAE